MTKSEKENCEKWLSRTRLVGTILKKRYKENDKVELVSWVPFTQKYIDFQVTC